MANVEVQPVLERDVVGLGPILGVHTRNPLSGGCVDRGAGLGHRRAPPSPNRCMAWSARYSASRHAARRYRTPNCTSFHPTDSVTPNPAAIPPWDRPSNFRLSIMALHLSGRPGNN